MPRKPIPTEAGTMRPRGAVTLTPDAADRLLAAFSAAYEAHAELERRLDTLAGAIAAAFTVRDETVYRVPRPAKEG